MYVLVSGAEVVLCGEERRRRRHCIPSKFAQLFYTFFRSGGGGVSLRTGERAETRKSAQFTTAFMAMALAAAAARVERKEGRGGKRSSRSINGLKWPPNPKFRTSLAIPLNKEGSFQTREEGRGRNVP